MPDARRRVFFSYARSDSEFVLKVAQALRSEGRKVWVDQLDIPKGGRWDDEVEKALQASSCLLVVLSPAATKSQNVLDEVSYALDENKTVLPIRLHSGSIPFRLKRLQYIDFTGDFEDAFRQLCTALDELPSEEPGASVDETAPTPVAGPADPAVRAQRREPEVFTAAASPAPSVKPATGGQRPFPKGIVYALVIAGVLAIGGYALFANMEGPSDEAGPVSMNVPAAPAVPPGQAPAPAAASVPVPADVATRAEVPGSVLISDAQVNDFVGRYLAVQNGTNAAALLRFYAERVDYFDEKAASKDFILKDKQNYYRRWPQVDNRLAGAVVVDRTSGDGTLLVSYTVNFRVANPGRADGRAGAARDEIRLRPVNGDLLIVAQRQKVLSAAN